MFCSRRPVPLLHRLEPLSVQCKIWHKCLLTVTSQVTHLPLCHGIKEAPSGLLPLLLRHRGSLIDCIFALVIVRHTMSFKMLCRVCLLNFSSTRSNVNRERQLFVHTGSHEGDTVAPRRRATAIRMASLSRKRPQLDNGSACNQSAECYYNYYYNYNIIISCLHLKSINIYMWIFDISYHVFQNAILFSR